jgi:hypothetical protein
VNAPGASPVAVPQAGFQAKVRIILQRAMQHVSPSECKFYEFCPEASAFRARPILCTTMRSDPFERAAYFMCRSAREPPNEKISGSGFL